MMDRLKNPGLIPISMTCGYFAVLKTEASARAIFNGKRPSALFHTPPLVCLPGIPEFLALMNDLLLNTPYTGVYPCMKCS